METYAEPGGSEVDTAAILTTAASGDIAHIHDRMPVVIMPEDFERWLDCRTREPRDVAHLMRTPDEGLFEAIPVSDKVNKVANTGPDLQERVEIVQPPKPPGKAKARQSRAADAVLAIFRRVRRARRRPDFRLPWRYFAGFFFGAQISAATIAAGPMAR